MERIINTMNKFVPDDFIVPEKLETDKFRLRMLSVDDVEKDYEAVMSSREHIRELYSEDYDSTWPEDTMTIEEDLEDLRRHQKGFLERKEFVYTVVSLDESLCLGCVYIQPSEKKTFDAQVDLWARSNKVEEGFEELLFKTVKKWVSEKWSFNNVAYPGFEIKWSEWNSIL